MLPAPQELSGDDIHTEHGSPERSLPVDWSSVKSHASDSETLSYDAARLALVRKPTSEGSESIMHRSQPDVIITSGTSVLHLPSTDVVLSATTETSYDELETPVAEEHPHRPQKVRFRSRVRITSGLNRQKAASHPGPNYLTFSETSSISGSSSSSLSAPLRSRADEEVGKPGWGTLGQRVSIFAKANSRRSRTSQRILSSKSVQDGISGTNDENMSEQTPLARHLRFNRVINEPTFGEHASERARQLDYNFGPWPNRLINHHWWWCQLEPIVCCHCLDDSDDDS